MGEIEIKEIEGELSQGYKSWINSNKTVEIVEVIHSKWKIICNSKVAACENCGTEYDFTCNDIVKEWRYCPSCGARMEG